MIDSADASARTPSSTELNDWGATLGARLDEPMGVLRLWFQERDRVQALQMPFFSAQGALVCERSAILFATLVNQLQAMRAVCGKTTPKIERVELAGWVRQTVHEIAPAITCYGHRLVLDGPSLPAAVMANPTLLSVALINLLDNAQKFSVPQTRIQLTVFQGRTTAGFSVEDEGPGLPRSFELRPFGRIDEGLGFASPGMGLGLFIASQVARLLGGTLTFRSIERLGTSFRIQLPSAVDEG